MAYLHRQKDCLTPTTPLEPGVEMFERGRASTLFPIQTELANRKHLSVVPEVDTPASITATARHIARSDKPRPVSEVTEIFETDEDDLSQFEEDLYDVPFPSVSTGALTGAYPRLCIVRTRGDEVKRPSRRLKRSRHHSPATEKRLTPLMASGGRWKDRVGRIYSAHRIPRQNSPSTLRCSCRRLRQKSRIYG